MSYIYTQSDDIFSEDRFDEIEGHYTENFGGMEYGVMGRIRPVTKLLMQAPRGAPHNFLTRDTGYVSLRRLHA